jgi:hypothetical protein
MEEKNIESGEIEILEDLELDGAALVDRALGLANSCGCGGCGSCGGGR